MIESIEGAGLKLIQPLFDAADPSATLIATTHEVEGKTYVNLWEIHFDKTFQLIEMEFSTELDKKMAITRTLFELCVRKPEIENDIRAKLGVIGLQNQLN